MAAKKFNGDLAVKCGIIIQTTGNFNNRHLYALPTQLQQWQLSMKPAEYFELQIYPNAEAIIILSPFLQDIIRRQNSLLRNTGTSGSSHLDRSLVTRMCANLLTLLDDVRTPMRYDNSDEMAW